MIKFINKHKILFILIIFFDVLVLTLSLIHIKYDVTCPASIDSIENVINIENESSLDGSINVVSVYSYEKVNLLSYLLANLNPYVEVSESVEYYDISYNDMYKGGTIQKRVSLYNAIIAGYKMAGYDLDYSFVGYIIHTKLTYADDFLEVGDIVTHVNGQKLSNEYSLSQAITDNREQIVNGIDHSISMTIIKNYGTNSEKIVEQNIKTKEFDDEGKKSYGFGLSVYAYNIPITTANSPSFQILWSNVKSIGPSGGLLQSFYVYEKLTGATLSSGLKIAGTGTVDIDGLAGPIGGIAQKIITAELSGVDIFFVPVSSPNYESDDSETNYRDALAAYNKLSNPHMKMVPVWSLAEIINYLTNYQNQE